jgi:hypothetical protein
MSVSFRRVGRFVTVTGFAALLLTGAARVGVTRFLASSRGKAMVSDRLGSAIGLPVEVSAVEVGDDGSSFGFRVLDPADPKSEVLSVPSASTDLSAADFVTGRVAPSALHVKNPSLAIRVAPDGQVLTPMPWFPGGHEPFPALTADGVRLTVRQEGRSAFAVGGTTVKLVPDGERIVISGSLNDPKWGEWAITGELHRGTRTGWVELACPDAPLNPDLLATIPFLPPGAFADVAALGRANVTVRLTLYPDRTVQPAADVRPVWSLFGAPLGPCFRLTQSSDGYRFEPVR